MEKTKIEELLEQRRFKELKEEVSAIHLVEIVKMREDFDRKQALLSFRLLAKEEAAEVFTDMKSDMREDLINVLTDS